jgi:hypothetical protein
MSELDGVASLHHPSAENATPEAELPGGGARQGRSLAVWLRSALRWKLSRARANKRSNTHELPAGNVLPAKLQGMNVLAGQGPSHSSTWRPSI